ncbi:MAG: hypothetical protein HYX22_01565 [Candidatus Yanofskybacteria bacterium]|nr:hypothetical protein [Candidatus Yanofskybacteria bacterium]
MKKYLPIGFFSLLYLFSISPVAVANTLPAPNHSIFFGYYHADAQYGDFKNEVKDYTNTQIIIGDSWIRPPDVAESDIQKLNEALSETAALGQKIVLIPSGDLDIILNAAAPFWDNVAFIYFADEPNWDKATTEENIGSFKNKIRRAGLSQKEIAINYTPEQILSGTGYQAGNLNIVGFEAYVDPAQQNNQDIVADLNAQIDNLKQKIGNKQMFIVIQAYDRNGDWKNITSLQNIQIPPYLAAYNDERVIGLLMFSYARPGGTRDNPILAEQHRLIWQAMQGLTVDVDPKNIPAVAPTSVWSPSQTNNGWWPSLSPDGKYVAYGNFGESWVTDLSTGQNYDLSKPAGLPDGARCRGGQWITSSKVTFICDSIPGITGFYRYEAAIGEWIARKTDDDPNNVVSSIFVAKDGHWASFLALTRIIKDNTVLTDNQPGGAIAISGDLLVNACTNENQQICVWDRTNLSTSYDVRTPLFEMDMEDGYITYGGFGPIRGIDPSGKDIDLTATAWKREGSPRVLMVNGQPWVATYTWDDTLGVSNVLIRPWGERKSIVLQMDAASLSVVYTNGNFIVAANNDRGGLIVQTIPADSPRVDLSGGLPSETPGLSPANKKSFSSPVLPVIPTEGLPSFGQLIATIFTWSLNILGIVVFVMIFFAGFQWFTAAGNTAKVNEAKSRITNAITGALILLAAWIILYTINPDLVGGVLTLPGVGTETETGN